MAGLPQRVCERILNGRATIPLVYVVFDLLELDGQSTLHLPFRERRRLLEELELHGPHREMSAVFDDGEASFAVAQERGLEGVVARRLRDPYRPAERGWLKVEEPRLRVVGARTRGSDAGAEAMTVPSFYVLAARADAARVGLAAMHMRRESEVELPPPRGGLPRLMTIEVTPAEIGPNGVKLHQDSRAKLAAAGLDVLQVERGLEGMRRGDKKLLAEVVYGAAAGVPRGELEEQLRWYGVAPTEEEEDRIARGEAVTFVLPGQAASG